jgi:hypothetical protein
MAFNGSSKPFVNAFHGFGRYSTAAAIGAGAAALALPAMLKNDDRGYARTAAVTTPAIAAGFMAAPDAWEAASSFVNEWGEFWKSKPFTFKGGLPSWKDPSALADILAGQGPHVRRATQEILVVCVKFSNLDMGQ